MGKLGNYALGNWVTGDGDGKPLYNAITGDLITAATSDGLDFGAILAYGRKMGGPSLRKMTFQERGNMLKKLALYLTKRKELCNVFVLLDSRLPPQSIDLEFMNWCGEKSIPFSMVFTKIDKISSAELQRNLSKYKSEMQQYWTELPPLFTSSAISKFGQEKILNYIEGINNSMA